MDDEPRDADPADFYTGLVAELYGPLRSSDPDPRPYRRFVERSGQPALELGCGDGDPMLDLLAAGLEVEGLDASADMLERCRERAAARGLDVTLHHARMEAMELGRTFRSIYLAGASFNLLPDDDTAARALERIAAHLTIDGTALVPLFVPSADDVGAIGVPREYVDEAGRVGRVTVISADRDDERRRQTLVLRYERIDADRHDALERPWTLHWFDRAAFTRLAEDAGLTPVAVLAPDGTPAAADARHFTFLLRRTP